MAKKYQLPTFRLVTVLLSLVAALSLPALLTACNRADRSAGPAQKVTMAVARLPETTLVNVAHSQGFFREEGIEERIELYPYGRVALRNLLEGKADFATVAETPTMFAIMNGAKVSVIATIVTSKGGHALVGRRDRGISAIGNLRGKKIATTPETSAQFFLDAMLVSNGMSRTEAEIVDLPAERLPDALARGEIDAVSAFAPYTVLARKKLGQNGVVFTDRDIYSYTFNVVASDDYIRKNPETVRKLLRGLVRAETYVQKNQAAAQKLVAELTGLEPDVLGEIWNDSNFSVTLNQALILALEDESDWAIKNRLTTSDRVPNYLSSIYLDGLLSVKPKAVRILK